MVRGIIVSALAGAMLLAIPWLTVNYPTQWPTDRDYINKEINGTKHRENCRPPRDRQDY